MVPDTLPLNRHQVSQLQQEGQTTFFLPLPVVDTLVQIKRFLNLTFMPLFSVFPCRCTNRLIQDLHQLKPDTSRRTSTCDMLLLVSSRAASCGMSTAHVKVEVHLVPLSLASPLLSRQVEAALSVPHLV